MLTRAFGILGSTTGDESDRVIVRRAVCCALVALTLSPPGQAQERIARIGLVGNTLSEAQLCGPGSAHPVPREIRSGMRALGWTEGTNLEIRCRSAEGDAA